MGGWCDKANLLHHMITLLPIHPSTPSKTSTAFTALYSLYNPYFRYTMTHTIPYSQTLLTLSADQLKQKLDQHSVRLIDVREPGEYAGEHIAGAENRPRSRFQPEQLLSTNDDRLIVLYCQSGNRSGQVGRQLLEAGLTNVAHLENGLPTWKAAGYPTQVNRNAPISIFRQVQIVAGSLVLAGTLLSAFVSPAWLLLSGFVGAGLVFAGVTNTCAMGLLLAKLPYNQQGANG